MADGKHDIFFVTVDALRADRLGCMGQPKELTPVMDSLAGEGTLFTQAVAPGSYTFVSFPSFMTSLYPSEYYSLGGSVATVAGELRRRGYTTVSFNSNPHAKGKLDRGFDHFDDLLEQSEFDRPLEKMKRRVETMLGKNSFVSQVGRKLLIRFSSGIAKPYTDAEAMNEQALRWLHRYRHRDEPLFFWIHYMDPHYPYLPPERYTDVPREDRLRVNRRCRMHLSRHQQEGKRPPPLTDGERETLLTLYDGETRYVDACIGRFIEGLREMGRYDDSYVFLFSDHGELFGEHGGYAHEPHQLHHRQLHVPLIARGPDIEPGRIGHPVTLRDIPATLMHLLEPGCTAFNDGDLFSKQRDYVVSEGFKPQHVMQGTTVDVDAVNVCCRMQDWIFVDIAAGDGGLYNVSSDPDQRDNLAGEKPELASVLADVVEQHRRRVRKHSEMSRVRRTMQHLGLDGR